MTKSNKPRRPHRTLTRRTLAGPHLQPASGADARDANRGQVRERLLRMILDNEEVRRNDRRPSAS
jgi:hypothetical protein